MNNLSENVQKYILRSTEGHRSQHFEGIKRQLKDYQGSISRRGSVLKIPASINGYSDEQPPRPSQHTRWYIPGTLVPGVWALTAKRGVLRTLVDWDNSGICCHNRNTVLLVAQRLMLLMFVTAIYCHLHSYFINCYSYPMSLP